MKKNVIGAVTLFISVVLILAASLFVMYSANNGVVRQKSAANQSQSLQAYQAASAGQEYGFVYLSANAATVTASKVNNAILYSLPKTTLSDNSSYVVTYTSPVNNFTTITINAVGTSADGTTKKGITQNAVLGAGTITTSATAKGKVTSVGGSVITNTQTNANILAGKNLVMNNGAYTVTSTGVASTQGNYVGDVQQNVNSLSSMNDAAFFQNTFGTTQATVKSAAQAAGTYYNNSVAGGDYSQTLSNKQGVTIWIDQPNVTLGQGVTIGAVNNPVTLIVNGNLTIANGVTFYGFVYVASVSANNSLNLAGGAKLTGGMGASGDISLSNGFLLFFNAVPVLTTGGTSSVSKVRGSWRDF